MWSIWRCAKYVQWTGAYCIPTPVGRKIADGPELVMMRHVFSLQQVEYYSLGKLIGILVPIGDFPVSSRGKRIGSFMLEVPCWTAKTPLTWFFSQIGRIGLREAQSLSVKTMAVWNGQPQNVGLMSLGCGWDILFTQVHEKRDWNICAPLPKVNHPNVEQTYARITTH